MPADAPADKAAAPLAAGDCALPDDKLADIADIPAVIL
jgi:hypothetical protein